MLRELVGVVLSVAENLMILNFLTHLNRYGLRLLTLQLGLACSRVRWLSTSWLVVINQWKEV